MNPEKPPPPGDPKEEVSALIETLHQTGQRLEELTAGEVDTVTDRRGRTVLLRRAQDHMRHNEAAKQAAILNALPAHIALLDAQGLIISVNEAWRRFASAHVLQGPGYGIGLNYLEICDSARGDGAAEAHQVAAGIRSVLAGTVKSYSIEYPSHSPLAQRWFLLTVTPLPDDPPNGAVVMHLDITERKNTESDLRWKTAFFESLVNTSADGIIVVDAKGRKILQNRRTSELWKIPQEIAKDPDDSRQVQFVMNQTVDAKQFGDKVRYLYAHPEETSQDEVTLKDGTVLDRYSAPVLDSDGHSYGRIWSFRDITERKRAAEALRESERRFSDLLRNVELVAMMLDREARITYCNEFLLRLTGWRQEEIIGKNWFELFVPPEIDDLKGSFFAALLANRPAAWHHENEMLTRSGERRLIRWNNSVLRSGSGDVIGAASIGEDITERKRAEQELAQLQRQSTMILESVVEGIYVIDKEGRILFPNPAAAKLLGYSVNELAGKPSHATVHHSRKDGTPYPEADCPSLSTMRDGTAHRVEDEVFWRKDGASFPVEYTSAPIRNDQGDVTGAVVAFRDITERRQAEDRIAYLNRVYAVLSGINTLIVRVRDRDELFKEACRIALEAGGFRMALIASVDQSAMKTTLVASAGVNEAFLTALKDHFSLSASVPFGSPLLARAMREKKTVVISDLQSNPEVVFRKQYVESGIGSMAILPLIVPDETTSVLVLYASETEFFQEEELKLLTELAGDIAFAIDYLDKQERLDYLAYYDVLTGLANRSLFLERVAQYMRSAASGGHKLALYLIDLDRFRNINDSLGRPAGDALLRQVAEWLTRNVGDANLLARLDADHFAVVLPEIKHEGDVARLLENMLETFLRHPFRLNDAVFSIAIKIGVALFPDDGADADTLFKHAEAALKKAKASGERYLFYTQRMTEAVAGKLALENQLRQALDHGEFVLYYQPKVNLVSGKMTSAEALIRWNDPRTGLVPPGRFIPLLEETGLIYEVGRWALRQAIADYMRWRAAGLAAVRIAVNVSPLQLRHPDFIAEIRQKLDIDVQVAAGLELEITESLIMADVEHSIASLQAIRAMGVTIAIDDFGTGFSSLSYLAKLPVDTLKIDRSFVIDMTVGPQGLELVSTIINLAHSLKLKVVAEGVETEEQSRLLRLLNCDEMQGFLFSEPVPGEIFEAKFLAPASGT